MEKAQTKPPKISGNSPRPSNTATIEPTVPEQDHAPDREVFSKCTLLAQYASSEKENVLAKDDKHVMVRDSTGGMWVVNCRTGKKKRTCRKVLDQNNQDNDTEYCLHLYVCKYVVEVRNSGTFLKNPLSSGNVMQFAVSVDHG